MLYVGGWCPSCKQNGRPTVLVCLGSSLSLSGSLSIDPPSPLRQAPKNTFFPFSQQVSVIPPLLFACIFRLTQKKRVVSNKACCDYCSCCLLTFVGYLSPLLLFSNGDGGVKRGGATKWSFPFLGTGGPKHKGVLTIGERERSPHFFSAKDLFFLPRQPTDPPFLWRFMGKKWSG